MAVLPLQFLRSLELEPLRRGRNLKVGRLLTFACISKRDYVLQVTPHQFTQHRLTRDHDRNFTYAAGPSNGDASEKIPISSEEGERREEWFHTSDFRSCPLRASIPGDQTAFSMHLQPGQGIVCVRNGNVL